MAGTYELILQILVKVIFGSEPVVDGLHGVLVLLGVDVFLKLGFHNSLV